MKIPTGVEIIHKDSLKDQVLVEIPMTKFHLHGLHKENKTWEVSIINQTKGYKRKIFNNLEPKGFRNLLAVILTNPKQENFKTEPKIKWLISHYKKLIKGSKA